MIARARASVEAYLRLPWLLRAAAVLAWAALIWWNSSRPSTGPASSVAVSMFWNSAHIVVFGVLAMLVLLACGGGQRGVAVSLLVSIGYAILDEVHQSHVPGRIADAWDVASDTVGAAMFASAVTWLREQPRWAAPAFVASACLAPATVVLAS